MKISAHILLKNEARFCWYSIMSVINYVDVVRIWDTGSSDETNKIITEISKTNNAKDRNLFEIKRISGDFNEESVRRGMLEADIKLGIDWAVILDADEIWWNNSISGLVEEIKASGDSKIESIVVPTYNLVGDMFHFQEKAAGRYRLVGRVGHFALRAFSLKIPGLNARGEHGVFGWFDNKGIRIENREAAGIKFVDLPYLHTTHLRRAGNSIAESEVLKRSGKLKYEIGEGFPLDFYFPEVFFRARPSIVPSVWQTMSFGFKLRSFFETPLKKICRRTILPFKKHGY